MLVLLFFHNQFWSIQVGHNFPPSVIVKADSLVADYVDNGNVDVINKGPYSLAMFLPYR